MSKTTISIVIPTLNCKGVISRAMNSIIEQNLTTIEVIISDGGSADGTVDFSLATLASNKIPASAVIYPGSSIYQAINLGIKIAAGEWIYILGSDDRLYQSDVLQCMEHRLSDSKADVVYGDAWAGESDGFLLGGVFDLNRLCRENICHQALFYRRSALQSLQLEYNIKYELLADWDYNLRLLSHHQFQHIPIIIAFFSGKGRSSTERDHAFERDRARNILRYFGFRTIFMLHPLQFEPVAAVTQRPFQGHLLRQANRVMFPLYRRFARLGQQILAH
ncbi:glycosyltransferase [Cyanobium sp. Lug-B]|uniref:glycosyltransferase n=1 Tax=Cyanobium sp. Lug-B TaxID=2823716 RepID=UPI0020CC3249|nr:glycosyltransferase [Cyanobium sp. Lug-B]MCP9797477.1 glycosyltransferase [Cyanobium sp. Lug-B]